MRWWIYIVLVLIFTSCGVKKQADKEQQSFSSADYPYIEKFHQGLRLKQKGQYTQAIEAFESCKVMHPKDDAVYYALAQLYLLNQDFLKSSEAIQEAVKLDPENKWYIQEYAYMLFEVKNYKEAAKQFKALIEKEPSNIDWLFSYAESLMRSGELTGAVKALDKLENEIGLNPELSIQKYTLYRKAKQDSKALTEIEKALKIFPHDVQLLANLVDFYFEKKEDEKAFSILMRLAENDPMNGNAHLALAQYYDQKGNRKESYAELLKAYVCDDIVLDTKIKILLSMFESQYKVDEEMYLLSAILIEKYPEDARVYTVRGDFYLKDSKDELALSDYKKALEYDKTKFAIWDQVLLMEYKKQDYKALYKDAKTCLEYFPSQAKVYVFFGLSANQIKEYTEAYEKLQMAEELVSQNSGIQAEIYAQKGEACFGLKKVKEGIESYEKAIKLDEKNLLFKNNYAYRLAIAKIELDKAEKLIAEVLSNSPNEAHFIDTYGWILFQRGKYKEAQEQFEKAIKISPGDKHIIEHLGDAQFKNGDIGAALVAWKKAKDLGSTNQKLSEKIEKKAYYDPVY